MVTTAWLVLLGFLLAGYFVLGGYDYGVQVLLPVVGRDEAGRRAVLAALGPWFFGNEVWLVAFAGVLFGAFPVLEGTLLSGLHPLMVLLLVGLVLGKAAVQLRSRAWARLWDVLVVVGGVVPAVAWGLVVGVLLNGVPRGASGAFGVTWSMVLDPFVVACGLTSLALFTAHGAVLLSRRLVDGARARALVRPLIGVVVVGLAVCLVLGWDAVGVVNPGAALVVVGGVLVVLGIGYWRRSFLATACAAASLVVLLGVAQYPYVLVSTLDNSMTVAKGAADPATLAVLSWFGVLVVPLVVAHQWWSRWAFRGRVDQRTPTYF